LSNAKYKYVKIQRKIRTYILRRWLRNDFGLLRRYCKISYLLAEEHWSHTNVQRFMTNVGNVFYPTFTNVFF